jgi:uncharacterized membrane protein HdeD (DUF308 family)
MAARAHGAMYPGARSARRVRAAALRRASEDLVRRAEQSADRSMSSDAMRVGLARNWWAIGMRAALAAAFILAILLLPKPTLGALTLAFAAYVAADGVMALIAGMRVLRRGTRWRALMFEGAVNISIAGVILIWPAMAAIAFVQFAAAWAIVTGALMLAAARRLARGDGRWPLAVAGLVSMVWGALAVTSASATATSQGTAWWLIGYALPFGAVLLVLAGLLRRRHQRASVAPA